jgi:hypothetical protein
MPPEEKYLGMAVLLIGREKGDAIPYSIALEGSVHCLSIGTTKIEGIMSSIYTDNCSVIASIAVL